MSLWNISFAKTYLTFFNTPCLNIWQYSTLYLYFISRQSAGIDAFYCFCWQRSNARSQGYVVGSFVRESLFFLDLRFFSIGANVTNLRKCPALLLYLSGGAAEPLSSTRPVAITPEIVVLYSSIPISGACVTKAHFFDCWMPMFLKNVLRLIPVNSNSLNAMCL